MSSPFVVSACMDAKKMMLFLRRQIHIVGFYHLPIDALITPMNKTMDEKDSLIAPMKKMVDEKNLLFAANT